MEFSCALTMDFSLTLRSASRICSVISLSILLKSPFFPVSSSMVLHFFNSSSILKEICIKNLLCKS
ncbi:hypothetical protein OMAG_002446 [Candidatus Omnitrophus magneticus]|uniref:Uncharacterized protein n=1 Tax=Candidatus Omnitrophus magneticus TaxID=1609969 RepID=A0A0F0CK67_9BACT|nr:hypothetical protein OMAG_002446 [Candidatus Omnitrophus magneticus]